MFAKGCGQKRCKIRNKSDAGIRLDQFATFIDLGK